MKFALRSDIPGLSHISSTIFKSSVFSAALFSAALFSAALFLASLFLASLFLTSLASADTWNLPVALDNQNTAVTFTVDTTWHTVHGISPLSAERVWLGETNNFRSIMADLHIPVAKLDTGNKSRDEELRNDIDEQKFPDIHFSLTGCENLCDPQNMQPGEACSFVGHGTLTIRDVTKQLEIPSSIEKSSDGGYLVNGKVKFRWLDYGITDPSMLIARVKPDVEAQFKLHLPTAPLSAKE